jgi:hypothetical protein
MCLKKYKMAYKLLENNAMLFNEVVLSRMFEA